MSDRRVDAFFYGLFMDMEILREGALRRSTRGARTSTASRLRIGQRATLPSSAGARAYGMLFALTHSELERLHAAPGLDQCRPEAVTFLPSMSRPFRSARRR